MVNEQLSGMLSGLRSSTDSSMAAFAKMEEKVMALEAEAEGAAMVHRRCLLLAPWSSVVHTAWCCIACTTVVCSCRALVGLACRCFDEAVSSFERALISCCHRDNRPSHDLSDHVCTCHELLVWCSCSYCRQVTRWRADLRCWRAALAASTTNC